METERLILRHWQESDVEALYELAKDEHVGPDCGWNPHKDIAESEFVLKNILMKEGTFAIVLKDTGNVIGNISIFKSEYADNDNQAEIGFWLGYPYWNKGYMSEACRYLLNYCFNEFKLKKIWCVHFEYNHKSARVQKKCGFRYHHTDYHHYIKLIDKTFVAIVNCMTSEEWKHELSDLHNI